MWRDALGSEAGECICIYTWSNLNMSAYKLTLHFTEHTLSTSTIAMDPQMQATQWSKISRTSEWTTFLRVKQVNALTEWDHSADLWPRVTNSRWSSPEEVSTQADHCVLSGVQTDVTLESAVLVAPVGRNRAAGSGTRVLSGRSRARGWRGRRGGHLKIDTLHKSGGEGRGGGHPALHNKYIGRPRGSGCIANQEETTRDGAPHKYVLKRRSEIRSMAASSRALPWRDGAATELLTLASE